MATRTYTHTAIHRELIDAVLRDFPGAATTGLPAALRELVATLPIPDSAVDALTSPRFIPDAFRLNPEGARIEIYEVEISSPLTPTKIFALGSFWAEWDDESVDWAPVLILVDRYGHRNEVDLLHACYATGPFRQWEDVLLA